MSQDARNGDTSPLAMLLQRVERDREQRCRELLEAARSDASTMRAEAHAQARRRVHQVITEERRRVADRLNSVRAEQETRQRQQRHRRINAALERGWELLEAALEHRWQSAEGRRAWIAGALAQAEHFLPPGTWTLRHPPELARSELPAALDRSGDPGPGQVTLASQADPDLTAGVRIQCGGAELDATPAGLLVDSERIRAWLLAAIEEHRRTGGDGGGNGR
jgi:hypothetical protein